MANNPIHSTLGKTLVVLDRVDSTNNYAMQQIRQGFAQNGSAYFAHEQWAGKGQRGKNWLSNKGENLILSTVLKPTEYKLTHPMELSVALALSCYDLVKIYLGADDVSIKWPNDVYWQDRKTGGILIESIWKASSNEYTPANRETPSEWSWAIAGTGINLNQTVFPDLGKKAVSILQITGKRTEPLLVARELLSCMENRLERIKGARINKELEEYNRVLYKREKEVDFEIDGTVLRTTVRGVDQEGKLMTDVGKFEWGRVKWL